MKLNDEQFLKIENLVLKRDSFGKDLLLIEKNYQEIKTLQENIVSELGDYIKEISGDEYIEGVTPEIKDKELIFKEKEDA